MFDRSFSRGRILACARATSTLSETNVTCATLHPIRSIRFTFGFTSGRLRRLGGACLLSRLSRRSQQTLTTIGVILPSLATKDARKIVSFTKMASNVLARSKKRSASGVVTIQMGTGSH